MAAVDLRCEGCNVTMLGASVSIEQLEHYVTDAHPHTVALDASLTTRLAAAADSISGLHRRGVPVIVGGAASGSEANRARRARRRRVVLRR